MMCKTRSMSAMTPRASSGLFAVVVMILLQNSGSAYSVQAGFVRQPPTCVNIPVGLKLCRNVGYNRMILPNLLHHESVDEVQQQAVSFVPLLSRRCHPHLQPFLCSLFAPVCLSVEESMVSGPIPPCRSLCESVRERCLPVMRDHSFEWPRMLNCSQFNEVHPCINIIANATDSTTTEEAPPNTSTASLLIASEPIGDICSACATPLEEETVVDNYCASEFVIKAKFKKLQISSNNRTRNARFSKKKQIVYKKGPLNKRDLKKQLKLKVESNKTCRCPQLDDQVVKKSRRSKRASKRGKKSRGKKKGKKPRKPFYLIMGRKVEKKLLVTVIHKWDKRLLNRLSKKFKASSCTASGLNRR